MTCNTDVLYGYGFEIGILDKTSLIDFMKNHEDTFCLSDLDKNYYEKFRELIQGDFEITDLERIFEGYACDASGLNGIGAVISNIMYRETGIRFEYQPGQAECDGEASVLFSETYPWNFNEVERELTEDAMKEICKEYMTELGISCNENMPGFLRIEYYG